MRNKKVKQLNFFFHFLFLYSALFSLSVKFIKKPCENLKPEKVLLNDNYYPQITNFRSSIKFEDGKEQTLSVCIPLYIAPEVMNDEHYTSKIDVFSLNGIGKINYFECFV